ncbi:hypothetical protein Tco_0696549 [Tanacetum coccineum]
MVTTLAFGMRNGLVTNASRCPRGGSEECQWQKFTQLLSSVILSSANDRWSWSPNENGVFLVKSAREVIDKHVLIISSTSTRWTKLIPIKLNNIFA